MPIPPVTGQPSPRGHTVPVTTKWAEVDLAALRDNTAALRRHVAPGCDVMAMVKANGYGHGAVHAARAALAGGATWLGVSSIAEAVELRSAGVASPILNIGWTMPEEMEAAVAGGIDVTVFDPAAVAAAAAAARTGAPVRVHWKLDTGMGRLGTRPDGVGAVRDALLAAAGRVEVVALFTHFAAADEASTEFTLLQHERFLATVAPLRAHFPRALLHCANSAALLRLPQTHHDIVRPGIALYGYAPPHCAGIVPLRAALSVAALVSQVKEIDGLESIGYGREWIAPRRARVATVAAGYADGVDRRNGGRGSVIVRGTQCPIIGRVSMDQLSVDVSAVAGVECGDPVIILGAAGGLCIDAATIADGIGTIANEVLCAVSSRVLRVPVNGLEEVG